MLLDDDDDDDVAGIVNALESITGTTWEKLPNRNRRELAIHWNKIGWRKIRIREFRTNYIMHICKLYIVK